MRGAPPLQDGLYDATFHHDTATDDVATTGEIVAVAGDTHVVWWIHCGYSAEPDAGSYVQIKDGANVVWKQPITAAGPAPPFEFPNTGFSATKGNAMTVELSAGGTGIAGYLNVKTT